MTFDPRRDWLQSRRAARREAGRGVRPARREKNDAHSTPAVAGMFFEGEAAALTARLHACFLNHRPGPPAESGGTGPTPRRRVGVPPRRAALFRPAAAHAYARLAEDPVDLAVILCPNHHGIGADNAVWTAGAWQTPLGSVPVDEDAARELMAAYRAAVEDTLAHRHEHSIEVQLPFLQLLFGPSLAILPVAMKRYRQDDCLALGKAIAAVVARRNAVVIASCDFSHYESAEHARQQDAFALAAIERLDPEGLFRCVRERRITTCGYGPVAAMLAAARRLGAARAETLAYTHSGEITGDHAAVVGYAAVAVTR